jgi:hypothetical protein
VNCDYISCEYWISVYNSSYNAILISLCTKHIKWSFAIETDDVQVIGIVIYSVQQVHYYSLHRLLFYLQNQNKIN